MDSDAVLLLYYCKCDGDSSLTRMALNVETAALGSLEYIPPSPLEFSISTRKIIASLGFHRNRARKESKRKSLICY